MNIYDFVTNQEAGFRTPIYLEDGWAWSFKEHVRLSFLYKNSQFARNNEDRERRPYKNIVRPVLNIHYRTEGFDVKDIELYVDNPDLYYKSFLIKKYHTKWALENKIDTFIDELVESYVDYGGALIKNVEGVRPEVVNLKTIAFCDQTDILSGAFAIKHYLSPSQLRDMIKRGWGEEKNGATMSVDQLISYAQNTKSQDKEDGESKTPSPYIEVYEVHNVSEMAFNDKSDDDSNRIYIISYYKDSQNEDQGVTLFTSKEPKLHFKFIARDRIHGRALGFGGVEELFDAQVWTNFSEIAGIEMLEGASKQLYKTNDPGFKQRNNIYHLKNGQILDLNNNSTFDQIDTFPRNLQVFNDAKDRWEAHAQKMGAASEALQGEAPTSGTPFKLYEAQIIENKGLHKYRQGQIATFVEELYREWFLDKIAKEIKKGQVFMTELSGDEMQQISVSLADNIANKRILQRILDGQVVTPQEKDIIRQSVIEGFAKSGNKKFFELLKDELGPNKLGVSTSIVGKQKNLGLMTDQLSNLLRQFISTPEIRQDPEMIRLLNVLLESAGLSPMIFGATPSPMQPQKTGGGTEGLRDLGQTTKEKQPV